MSKSKSLGSSPIGFQSGNSSSLSFIPDLGVSTSEENKASVSVSDQPEHTDDKSKKKVVSYYLEEKLIKELKTYAEEHSIYYSTLVSEAIKEWLQNNNSKERTGLGKHPLLQ